MPILKIARVVLPPGPAEPRAHDHPCGPCPSTGAPDLESEEIKTWPRAEIIRTAFPCAWRPERFCRGYCDEHGITDGDLVGLVAERSA